MPITRSLASGSDRDLGLPAMSMGAGPVAGLTLMVASYGFVVVRSVLYVFALGSRHGRRGCVLVYVCELSDCAGFPRRPARPERWRFKGRFGSVLQSR